MHCARERLARLPSRALIAASTWLSLGAVACGNESTTDDDATQASDTDPGDTGNETGDEPQWNSLAERPCPEDSYVTYENFGRPFLLSWCNGCHSADVPDGMRQGAPIDVNFDAPGDAAAWAERIWARSGDQNATMPPIGPPGAEERALLGEWLACGAP